MKPSRSRASLILLGWGLFWLAPRPAGAMHIMEGFLPPGWCGLWWLLVVPFWLAGYRRIKRLASQRGETLMLLGLAAAFIFVLSALKIPSITGSCSHMTGTGLGVILFGPAVVSVLGGIVLLFQALLLAHGGLTTLGANTFSLGAAGPLAGWLAWRLLRGRAPRKLAVFLAAMTADLVTYVATAAQLALAFSDPDGGRWHSLAKFLGLFAVTQLPLALIEGALTVLIVNSLERNAPEAMQLLDPSGSAQPPAGEAS